MSKLIKILFASCLVLTAYCSLVTAQSDTAQLSGTVVDQNGDAVPGAKVSIMNPATGMVRSVTSNESGAYVLSLLPPATYTVMVEANGFKRVQLTNIVLNVGDRKGLKVDLSVGDATAATVEVRGDAATVRTDSSVGTVVDRQFVDNIPLNGRSFQSLLTLTPGIVNVNVGSGDGGFSVNGQRPSSNSYSIDGVSSNFSASQAGNLPPGQAAAGNLPAVSALGTTQALVSVDALQEFRVEASTYSAEYGRQAGGQIIMTTRSGTNEFHGSAFEYIRNEVFNANNWFANRSGTARPPMRQNQFGGTFSGPVYLPGFGEGVPVWYSGKERTFFFFNYEGLRLRQPKFAVAHVPTAATRQNAHPIVREIMNAFPLPNGAPVLNAAGQPTGFAQYSYGYSDPSSLDSLGLRIDHKINERLSVFGRYGTTPSEAVTRTAITGVRPGSIDVRTLTVGFTSLVSTKLSNDLRVNFSESNARTRLFHDSFGGGVPYDSGLVIPSDVEDFGGVSSIVNFSVPGISTLSTQVVSNGRSAQKQFNVVDSLTYVTGSHQLKFGIDYRILRPTWTGISGYAIQMSLNSLAAINSGSPTSANVSSRVPNKAEFTNFSAYGHDTWKVSQRLTLNLGLRWEVNPPPSIRDNGFPLLAVTQIENLSTADFASVGTPLWKTTWNNFAPRIGASYLILDRPGSETILRGGFGVYYDTGNEAGVASASGFPYVSSRTIPGSSFTLPVTSAVAFTRVPTAISGVIPASISDAVRIVDPSLKLPYTLQWNFAVQRSLGPDQTFTASYVGAAGRRLITTRRSRPNPANPRFTGIFAVASNFEPESTSDYHALQTSFQRRLSKGLQVFASYTWSHALDFTSFSLENLAAARGNANFDIRHVSNAALTYDIPKLQIGGQIIRTLLSGWSVDTRILVQSALPLDVTLSSSVPNQFDGQLDSLRPNVIQGVPIYLFGSQYPGGRIFNNTVPTPEQLTSAGCQQNSPTTPARGGFCTPIAGQLGNLPRNSLRGLPAWQADFALNRRFSLTERVKLNIRGEAFNIFNHPNFGNIVTNITDSRFGEATNMLGDALTAAGVGGGLNPVYQIGGPRSLQFAVRLSF